MSIDLQDIQAYWDSRAHDFSAVRRSEEQSAVYFRWQNELDAACHKLSERLGKNNLRILDIGCGSGFFSLMLARLGHQVWGIDLSSAMLAEARQLCADLLDAAAQVKLKTVHADGTDAGSAPGNHVGSTKPRSSPAAPFTPPHFQQMNAEALDFPDHSFDLVLSRNLSWTLPQPEQAYREWLRVLRSGGLLLNYDANYAQALPAGTPETLGQAPDTEPDSYGHQGISPEQHALNAKITRAMPAASRKRPDWDLNYLCSLTELLSSCGADPRRGQLVQAELDQPKAPLFLVWAERR